MAIELKRYQVDAFAEKIFQGNPAVVCPLDKWLPDAVMQRIAMENNLSETAFYVKEGDGFRIRWFTPTLEVDLCGHATLATAFVLFKHEHYADNQINFQSRSGLLTVTRDGDLLTLDFPADTFSEIALVSELTDPFPEKPIQAFRGKTDFMIVFADEAQVRNCKPDFRKLAQLKARGVIVTARGKQVDFVSRFFGPQAGVDEDPVTGSAHTTLTPYWAAQLSKQKLTAEQVSARSGKLVCQLAGNRVKISGLAVLFSSGVIYLNDELAS
jgi:PhzF family phenazine biosynthesis protein